MVLLTFKSFWPYKAFDHIFIVHIVVKEKIIDPSGPDCMSDAEGFLPSSSLLFSFFCVSVLRSVRPPSILMTVSVGSGSN